MMIVMRADATAEEIKAVQMDVKEMGLQAHTYNGVERSVIGVLGDSRKIRLDLLRRQGGDDRLVPISRPYKLASREFRSEDTVFPVDGISIGDGSLLVIAGPCSVEDRTQLLETAKRSMKLVPISCEVVPTSHAPRLIHSRAWGKRVSSCWRKRAS